MSAKIESTMTVPVVPSVAVTTSTASSPLDPIKEVEIKSIEKLKEEGFTHQAVKRYYNAVSKFVEEIYSNAVHLGRISSSDPKDIEATPEISGDHVRAATLKVTKEYSTSARPTKLQELLTFVEGALMGLITFGLTRLIDEIPLLKGLPWGIIAFLMGLVGYGVMLLTKKCMRYVID